MEDIEWEAISDECMAVDIKSNEVEIKYVGSNLVMPEFKGLLTLLEE